MRGELLALGAVGALVLASSGRSGSRGVACEGPWFHTTTWDRLRSIAEEGLEPGRGSRFGGFYGGWSRGKLFVARGYDEGGQWFQKVSSVVEHGAEIREEAELEAVVSVMLRLDLRGLALHQDEVGGRDIPCSFYVKRGVGPERIWYFDGSSGRWRPVEEWDRSDPMAAFESWEQEWEEQAEDDDWPQGWISFHLREPWDQEPGAFAPPYLDEAAANAGWEEQLGLRGSASYDPLAHLGSGLEGELRAELAKRAAHLHVDAYGSLRPGIPFSAGRLGAVTFRVGRGRRPQVAVEHGTVADPRVFYALTVLAALDPAIRAFRVSVDNTPPLTVGQVVDRGWQDPERKLPVLYHGTSTALLDRILSRGLRPRRQTGLQAVYGAKVGGVQGHPSLPDRVYFTTYDAMGPARFAGSDAVRSHGGERVILRVDPTRLRRQLLEPDEDARVAGWVESIKKLGTVAYRGAVPPAAMQVWWYPDRGGSPQGQRQR